MDGFDYSSRMETCALCELEVEGAPLEEAGRAFCCPGCRAVWHILEQKGGVGDVRQEPLFQQAVKMGIISNPQLIRELHIEGKGERVKVAFEVEGMWCPSCAEVIRWVLLQLKGVVHCVVDYATDLASVEFCPMEVGKETLFQRITALGYGVRPLDEAFQGGQKGLHLRVGVAAFCTVNVMMLAYPLYATYFYTDWTEMAPLFVWSSFFFTLPTLFWAGFPIFKRAFISAWAGFWGMEVLVALGVGSAFFLSLVEMVKGGTHVYFDSLSAIICFILVGKVLENRAKFRAKSALLKVNLALPKRGRRVNGPFESLKAFAVGDCLEVRQGEKIVLDGIVEQGEGSVDEAVVTGEALPVMKTVGQQVTAGTLLTAGKLVIQVTSTAKTSTLQQIVELIEQEMGQKASYVRAADRVVRWFVPTILCLAVGTAITTDCLRAISVLLISCPCALGIAAPLAESACLHRMAELGAIVRNRASLALLGKEDLFAFDKTGTITEGKLELIDPLPKENLGILKALSNHSIHPLSVALSRINPADPTPLEKIIEQPGYGVKGLLNGQWHYLGSASWVGIKANPEATTVFFDQIPLRFHDQLRPTITATLKQLPESVLLSGDRAPVVAAFAKEAGFSQYLAEVTPLEKKEWIDTWRSQGKRVTMVGDGINDAPALAAATVGVAVLSATDLSAQVADILLTTHDLTLLPKLTALATKCRRIIAQNLFWAFFYNTIGIALALFGYLSPLFAAFAMVISSIIVILNAQRLT